VGKRWWWKSTRAGPGLVAVMSPVKRLIGYCELLPAVISADE
jgi:hypothetical protein